MAPGWTVEIGSDLGKGNLIVLSMDEDNDVTTMIY
jgi:hypothetical protein